MVNRPRWSSPVTKQEMVDGDGADIIDFIETHCRITKDSVAGPRGQLLEMRDWQQLQLYRMFARRADGKRKHRSGLLGVPRKNGKSGVAAGLALAEADMGPAGGEVYCCAGGRDQARIVHATAKAMIQLDPALSGRTKIYKNEIIWPATDTKLVVTSADADLQEGLNPTFVVFDEVHVQPDDELWDVMEQAMGARPEPMMLGITTAGSPVDRHGADSLCYRLYEHGKRVAKGEIDDPSFYFAWWEPDDSSGKVDWRDPEVWAQANPGLGDIVSLEDFEAKMKRGPEATVRTKRLNQWVVGHTAAIPDGKWEARAVERPANGDLITFSSGIEVPTDWLEDAAIFLDGSWSGDSTGIVGCTRDGFQYVITCHEKGLNDGPDWRVPVTAVEDDIRLALDNGARGCLYDPHRWQRTGQVLEEEGYPIVEWPTNSLARIVPAWKQWRDAILDGELSHDGNLALARHVGNVVLKQDGRGDRPNKQTRTRKIDLCICAIGAYVNRDLEFVEAPKRAKLWSSVA